MKKEQTMPNFVEMEKNVLKYWQENDSFNKLKNQNAGKPHTCILRELHSKGRG